MVARCNPKTYCGSYNPVELEEWIRSMKKIFTIVEVLEENKVTIKALYFPGEAEIWWNTMKDKFTGPEFTWNKFLGELRANFFLLRFNNKRKRNSLR